MKKSLILIVIVAIIAGLIVIFTAGFNFDLLTKEHQQIQLSIGEEFDSNELKKIVEEAIGQKTEIQKNGDFEDQAIISAKEIPSDKLSDVVTKVNEKYGKEITVDSIVIKDIPGTKLIDLIMPYVVSIIASVDVVLLYLAVKYKALGWAKVILKSFGNFLIAGLLAVSLIALLRIPVGNNIATIIFSVYTVAVLVTTARLEEKLKKYKLEEQKEKTKK